MNIRAADEGDLPQILSLNDASVQFLSPLDLPRLTTLHSQAAYHRVIDHAGRITAFLLAFREGAAYDSPNYRWFAARFPRFLYIDRVVVSSSSQGQGAAKCLYDDLFAFARRSGVSPITCEIDLDPPNPVSQRFHARHGFREIGTQTYGNVKKLVSLQVCDGLPLGEPPGFTTSRPHESP